MRRYCFEYAKDFLVFVFIVLSVGSISTGGVLRALSPETGSTSVAVMGRQLYEEMRLDQWVCFDAFMQGLRGSEKIDRKIRISLH